MDQPTQTHRTDDPSTRSARRRVASKQTTAGGVALALLVAAYTFAQPVLNERMGWNLPAITQPAQDSNAGDAKTSDRSQSPVVSAKTATSDKKTPPPPTAKSSSAPTIKPGPLAGRVPKPNAATNPVKPDSAKPGAAKAEPTKSAAPTDMKAEDPELLYGILKDLGNERYVSAAGLMYTRGSAEGHRLNHLERHTEDDPSRPGKHGVFDGGMKGALAMIDRAYQRAKTGTRTTTETDQGRTIYTVDMGSRVGYIGGRDGNRQKKPMARRVRIVLDQNRVITAYPL